MRSILWLASAFTLFCMSQSLAACRDDVVWLRGDWGQARFTIELAQTPQEQARGLMFRKDMPSGEGMMFLYNRPQQLSFWMRNTLIPLDMIFVRPDGVIAHVHHRAIPRDETPIYGGKGLVAVLEINGGLAEQIGIAPGSQLRHPFFGPEAAWPC